MEGLAAFLDVFTAYLWMWEGRQSEAIALVTDKLGKLRLSNQSHTVGCLLGSDRGTVPHLFARFMTAYGSPNFFRTPSIKDSYELSLYLNAIL